MGPLRPGRGDAKVRSYRARSAARICGPTKASSWSFRKGPLANKPESSGSRRLAVRLVFSRVLTKPPALRTKAAPATTSHSFLGVSVKVMSARPTETSASL